MTTQEIIKMLGLIGAICMPFWNIPLMLRIVRRGTSRDISLAWLFGVWVCIILMLPSTLSSPDIVMRAFGITNITFFTMVVMVVLRYRKGQPKE